MTSRLALALLASLVAAPVLAHSPRHPTPMARLDALATPGLSPARALMAEMMDDLDLPAPRRILPAVGPEVAPHEGRTRRILPFFWSWRPMPVVVTRHSGPRCDVVYSPYGGRVETCTVGPYVPLAPTLHGIPELRDER